jgi:diguanylate cyclase (GGDEF)-like protein/PAS domain S-box-containing protein
MERRDVLPLPMRARDVPAAGMLLLPVALLLLIGFAVLAGVVAFFAGAEDQSAIAASQALALSSLDVEKREIGYILDSFTWWNEAVDQVTRKMDAQWLDDNFGSYQTRKHRIFASFVVDPQGKTIVAFLDGKATKADAFKSLSGGLDLLIASTRVSSLTEPSAAAGYLTFGGAPVIVGAEAITPEEDAPPWPANVPRYVLIFARHLDSDFLQRVAARAGIRGLHLLADGEPRPAALLPLILPDKTTAGLLAWNPRLPATDLILSAAPVVGGVLLFMAGLFWWFSRHVQRISYRLREQAAMIDQIPDAVFAIDPGGTITRWSAGAEKMLSYEPAEVLGKPISLLLSVDESDDSRGKFGDFPTGANHLEVEGSLRRKNGELFHVHLSLAPIKDVKGQVIGTISYAMDNSRQKQLEARLEQLATVDELTGAYNRRHLQVNGPIELQRARRFKRPLAVLMFDLDHFKLTNDRFGHQFGDLVLSTFAKLCRQSLRSSDLFVRHGGEEFLAVMPETELDSAVRVGRRIAEQMRATVFSTNPLVQGLTVSIGATALRESDENLETIVERADKLMYRAKELGRDRIEAGP